ncbi:MAG: FkbM family methyltransferase, partial [Acidobacteriota bacterium]
RLQSILSLINQKPRPSLNNLDEKLSKYLNYENGFFVELGANNGYSQSNTFFLEYCKNWNGILIEGIEELSWLCRFLRLKSKTIHAACVDFSYPYDTVKMRYANLMSIVKGALKDESADNQHITKGMEFQNIKESYEVEVPAKTLTSIFIENDVHTIDFLSLDVEGYEADVLRGLDLQIFQPKFICVEARFFEEVDNVLKNNYFIVEQLTHHDYLYKNLNFK